MLIRTRLLLLLIPVLLASGSVRAASLDGSPPAVGAAEAARLYERANDYVTRMQEGEYSYVYLQFYWKRAQANVDRVERVYPDSPTARALESGQLKLGPYALGYFRDRVLYDLELKRVGSLDQVNCPIFLYGLDPKRADGLRDAALESIIETLARQQRWGEALIFPVLNKHRPLLLGTIFRVASRYDQKDIVERLIASTPPAMQEAASFWPSLAEAQALLGKPRGDLDALLKKHPQDAVRRAALLGIVRREVLIRRLQALHVAIQGTIATTHFELLNLQVRDDVRAAAARFFPGRPGAAEPILAVYRAALGEEPAPDAPKEAHLAYLRFLADADRFDAIDAYADRPGLGFGAPVRLACRLDAIELYAEAGRDADADRRRGALADSHPADADQAGLAEFRGQLDCTEHPVTIRQKTFASLPIHDPCVLAVAIGDWALCPNQSIRGAAPWDAVVYRFAGGFERLPAPASKAVSTAASTLLPY